MPTKTIDGTVYWLSISRDLGLYEIAWNTPKSNGIGRGTPNGHAEFTTEYEAAAVWAALSELE